MSSDGTNGATSDGDAPVRRPGGPVRPDGVISSPGDRRPTARMRAVSPAGRGLRQPVQRRGFSRNSQSVAAPHASEAVGRSSGIIAHRVPFRVRRRLATGERLEVAQHEHSVVLLPPVLIVIGSLFLVYALSALTGYATAVVSVLGVAWLGVVLWAGFKWWEHEVQWLVITDKRVMRIDGIIEKVAMLPLARLTDIAYERSIWGQVFGYGKFTLESAGQIQALREINFIQRPNKAHEKLTELLYRTEDKSADGT